MKQSESISKLAGALAKAQEEMPEIPMDGVNPHFKSKFSTLGAVIKAVRPVFAKHGLVVLQLPSGDAGVVGLTTRILHNSGEWIEQELVMPLDGKTNPGQEVGKLITYFRRYGLASAAGVYSEEDTDNEGKRAGEKKPVTNTIITDAMWTRFQELYSQAEGRGIELAEYKRSELNVEQITKIAKELKKQLGVK